MPRKFFTVAVVTAFASCIGYLAGAWVIIYGLKPEHPEIAPWRLFREAWSHIPVLMLLLTAFELFAFGCAVDRVAQLSLEYVISIAAEVSGLVALIHGLLSDLSAFGSLWWQLILGSAPVVVASTVLLIHFRTRVRATAA